jgi:hypothetical protein
LQLRLLCACKSGEGRRARHNGARRSKAASGRRARCSSCSARINARTPRSTLRRYGKIPWPCYERCAACCYGHASTQRALDVAPELQRRHPPRQRYSLRARRTHALSSHTKALCERRRSTTGCAPPGTGDDVAASLCRPSATRRRCHTRRDLSHRRQGCCPQRRAQETGVACRSAVGGGLTNRASGSSGGRSGPGRPSALSLQTRAAGRVHGGDGGGAARGTQRARRHAANEPLLLPHAGRLEGSRGAPLRHDACSAARAGVLQCRATRGRCARCSAVALRAAQATRARGVTSGCAADARGACSGARYAARCDAQPFTGVTRRVTVRDTLLGCAARLRAGCGRWRRLLQPRAVAQWLVPRCRSALLNVNDSVARCAGRATRQRRSSGAHAALARPGLRGCAEN